MLIRGIFGIITVFYVLGAATECWAELRLLLSVFRHGDRYPYAHDAKKTFYPLNPHANISWFPDSSEGLTIEGKRRSYELGEILRRRYGQWLGPNYSEKLFKFHSSFSDRTIATSMLVAAGLFPPSDSQRWNSRLNWQPIPIWPLPREESVLYFGMFCTEYLAALAETKSKDPTIVKYDEDMKEFYDYISINVGAPVTNRILYYLYMELDAAKSGGLDPPEWAKNIYPDGKLREATIMEYHFSSWTDELKRYAGGLWLREWLENVSAYLASNDMNNNSEPRAFFYGGHDVNIAGIMTTLGIYDDSIPNFGSAINFELHEDDIGKFYVKMLYRNSDEFTERIIPGCGDILCPLETFKKIFANVVPSNGTLACGTRII